MTAGDLAEPGVVAAAFRAWVHAQATAIRGSVREADDGTLYIPDAEADRLHAEIDGLSEGAAKIALATAIFELVPGVDG